MRQGGGGTTSTTARSARRLRALASMAVAVLALSACADDTSPAAGSETTAELDATTTTTTVPGGDSSDDSTDKELGDVADPVAFDAATDFGNGVGIELTSIDSVEVEGRLPGEISGPGLAITIEITNGSEAEIQLDNVTVDLTDATGASASPATPQGEENLSGPLAVGASTTGTYLFTLRAEDRAGATLRVSYTADAPTVLFTGDLPR